MEAIISIWFDNGARWDANEDRRYKAQKKRKRRGKECERKESQGKRGQKLTRKWGKKDKHLQAGRNIGKGGKEIYSKYFFK
jgi:hypothetical protein